MASRLNRPVEDYDLILHCSITLLQCTISITLLLRIGLHPPILLRALNPRWFLCREATAPEDATTPGLSIGFPPPMIGGSARQPRWTTGEMACVTGAPGPSRHSVLHRLG